MNMILSLCILGCVIAMVLSLYRIGLGPRIIDRAVAMDVLTACLNGIMMIWAAKTGRTDFLIVVIILSLTMFLSSTVIARFARDRSGITKRKPTAEEQEKLDRLREQEEARFVNQERRLARRIRLGGRR